MAEFRLERFKYNWRGNWQSSIDYKRDDVVRLNGKSYVCIVTHTSSAEFRTDLNAILPGSNPPQPQPRWAVMTNGRSFEGPWQGSRAYNLGDIVYYDGSLWNCVVSHTSSNFSLDFANWTIFAQTISFVGDWTSATTYAPGAVVKYNGIAYKCVTAHTASLQLSLDIANWELYHVGIEVRNDWEPLTEYRENDYVKYGGSVYRCTETHTSNSVDLDDDKFVLEVFGSQYDGDWNSTTYYNIGDIVRHQGFMYYAINNSIDSKPFLDSDQGSQDWILLARSYSFIGEWDIAASYKTGDIVLRGGNLYLALRDIGGNDQDGSTTDYLEDDTWELLVPGKRWKGFWTDETLYSVGDVVYYLGNAYTCNFEHEADPSNYPGDNGNGFYYWDILIEAGQPGGLQYRGDILTYGPSRDIDQDGSSIFDGSTLGNTRVPIGEAEQILSVSSDLEVFWRDITVDADAVYVSKNGIDDFNRGTFEKPFRTIRYACEYVEDAFAPLTPVIVRVGTGRFEEVGPIVIPAGCAVNGNELRSTTVVATGPIADYQNDLQYVRQYFNRIERIILGIVQGFAVEATPGNTATQITRANLGIVPTNFPTSFVSILAPAGSTNFNLVESNTLDEFPISTLDGTGRIVTLLEDFINYVSFYIESGSINPTLTGANTYISGADAQVILNAANALELNKVFLTEEILAYLRTENPGVTFNTERVRRDVHSLIRGLIRDIRYSGNYGTLTAAKRYANATLGSKLDDLFLARDTTGVRDLTTGGLEGELQPPRVFELYQRPTGGSCVALDPGWGPDDERTWIVNRSPYIQGVTNTGFGCVGMKVDGELHNGGNKSMTANDFTQVLSDGIGAWIVNNARAELVSVFTYYCQIGYFAENGGVIRATNGNNSYGQYGAIADGSDDTETPQNVTVMNRNNEAQVLEAFAGGAADQLFAFEYSHCGEQYTSATATIIGSGSNASVEFTDFRDNSIFEARLTKDLGDSGTKGGSGYLTRQGAAQETIGAASVIKLSANDITLDVSEIEGMRLLITGGTGVGQYGIVSSFNFINKEVDIVKESDGTPGWDHVIPGTPSATNLDLTTRYRIEPRLTVSDPGFTTTGNGNLFANRTFVGFEQNNTRETFTNVSGAAEISWVDDNGDPVTLNTIVSGLSLQVNGSFATNPLVPFNIRGNTSDTTATVTAITANTGGILEVDISGSGNSFELDEEFTIILVAGTGNTFDDDPVPATFDITRVGKTYTVILNSPGAGYSVSDEITIPGTAIGGATPSNDITITITDVTDDSASSIQTFTYSGIGKEKRFVALTNAEYALYSDNGLTWTEVSLPFIGDYRSLISSDTGRFIGLARDTNQIAVSLTGATWTTGTLPFSAGWRDGTYGGGRYVLVADDTNNVLVSSNGTSWTTRTIPDDTGGVDSSISQWSYVTYGKGIYLAVSANDRATATSTDGGVTWTRNDEVLPDLSPADDWSIVGLAYGNGRFVILDSLGRSAYSFDGATWYVGGTVSGSLTYTKMKYGNGVFFALALDAGNATSTCVTSEDGLIWTTRTIAASARYGELSFGSISGEGRWTLLANAAQAGAAQQIVTGKRAKLRADVLQGRFETIKIWDPGSGYTSIPTVTVTDPNAETDIRPDIRLGSGVLAQPDFINRGSGYRTSTSTITISGDGFADIIPEGNELILAGVSSLPGPGVQIRISSVFDLDTEDDLTDLKVFNGVSITDLGDDGSGNRTRLVKFTLSPSLRTEYSVTHNTAVTLRERYSQCRITGHDFLDIGTGNFEETNYPEIYSGGNFFVAAPENEVFEANGGRVFYTSSDQDGNFRTGELFAVNQATGIVTISAQFFELDGLTELALGGVRLGGSGTVVNEFSTDPTFAADSNSVIPTQRAIATFLANRLSVGGENLEVNRLVAGRIGVGGVADVIENVTREYIVVPVDVVINGKYTDGDEVEQSVGIQGTIVSQMLFLKRFDEGMQ